MTPEMFFAWYAVTSYLVMYVVCKWICSASNDPSDHKTGFILWLFSPISFGLFFGWECCQLIYRWLDGITNLFAPKPN